MFGLLIALIVITSITGRRRDRRRSDFFKLSLAGVIGIGILATVFAPYLLPLALIFLIIYAVNKSNESKRNSGLSEEEWSEQAKTAGYDKKKTTVIDEFLDGLFGAFDYNPEKTNRNPYSTKNTTYGYTENVQGSDRGRLEKELEILRKNGRGGFNTQNAQYQNAQYRNAPGQGMGNPQYGNAPGQGMGNPQYGNPQYQNRQGYNPQQNGGYQYRRPNDADFNKGDMRLPTAPKKRRKIVETFNEKYSLNLTDNQIESIVNASYFSAAWHKEIVDMNKKYTTVHQWMNGPLAWLRAYLYVFPIQDITSDLYQQERIVVHAYDQVFAYLDSLGPMSMENRVRIANQKFLTEFDDITFMEAYHFLRSKGINYELKTEEISASYDPIDDLVEKYADPIDSLVEKYAVDGQNQPVQR
ncbi:MAG: hypothetical protein IKQ56_03925 [Lachnospiraceae bacterium]|nr:hypothetical protein [Lachnospiraceae bacterium]